MDELIQNYAKRLKLSWIRKHYKEVKAESHEDYLLTLFEKEIEQREQRKINLMLKQASFPKTGNALFQWDDIQLPPRVTQQNLLAGEFIEHQENVILYGGVGTGKTYLSTLIGLNVIHHRKKRLKFYTVAGLVNKLLEANEKGTLDRLYKQIEKPDLLILDELGYIPLHKEGAELLFQVISMCYEMRSIIVTTNLQFSQWNHVFGDQILTEAVIDRLIHHSHLIIFSGESHRYKESMQHD